MGTTYRTLDERLIRWIGEQQIFFVATAPSGPSGHVNVSPKGHADTFAVLDERTVAYLDLTGSGAETAAHLRDNGRITVMFCAFAGPPQIVRLYGGGRVVLPDDEAWEALAACFPAYRGARSIVVVDLDRIADSCGYAVPRHEYVGERDLLERWTDRKDDGELEAYRRHRNETSIDGLPAFLPPFPVAAERLT
jgi:pyridoxamine 5'-phosphate oxidase-like protein